MAVRGESADCRLTPTLAFHNMSYSVENRWTLRNITLTVQAGETLALLGRSGAGETTLLKMANALANPTGGLFDHFQATGHPLVRSIEPGEAWMWCYVDRMMPGQLER